MSGEERRRRVSTALDMPGGLEGPLHARLRDELAKDPESQKWAQDVQKLDALLRSWPEQERADEAWEGLAARISQRLSEALPAGLDFTTPPFFDDEDARTARPDASSGGFRTEQARKELEAKRAQFSLAQLSHLDAPKSVPPPPIAGNPQLEVVPSGPLPPAALPKPIARPQGEERFTIPTFSAPLAPLPPPPALVPATEKSTRGRWLLLGGAGFAAAAVVLLAVLVVVPGLSSDTPDATLAAAAVPMAAEASAPPALEGAPVIAAPTVPVAPPEEAAANADRMPPPAAAPVAAMTPTPGAYPMAVAPALRAPAAPRSVARPSGGAPAPAAVSPLEQAVRPRPTGGARTGGGGGGGVGEAPGGGGASAGGGAATARGGSKRVAPAGPLAAAPSRADVLAAMGSVRSAVAACAGGRGGLAQVRVTFSGSSGRVTGAQVEGQFAGTPQGSCIARAVRTASLQRFEQPTYQVLFPFQL